MDMRSTVLAAALAALAAGPNDPYAPEWESLKRHRAALQPGAAAEALASQPDPGAPPEALARWREPILRLAGLEGLEGHARSLTVRTDTP